MHAVINREHYFNGNVAARDGDQRAAAGTRQLDTTIGDQRLNARRR